MAHWPSAFFGLAMPFGQAVEHVLAVTLHGHVDDGGDATPRRRARTGFERVGCERATEGQLHVRVHVDTAGDDVLARGIDDLVATLLGAGEPARQTDCGDGFTIDENVLIVDAGG